MHVVLLLYARDLKYGFVSLLTQGQDKLEIESNSRFDM